MTMAGNFGCFFMSKPNLRSSLMPGVGVVDPTIALFSDMGQGNFKCRPAARLTPVVDRAVMR
jgi:hypothetical protein